MPTVVWETHVTGSASGTFVGTQAGELLIVAAYYANSGAGAEPQGVAGFTAVPLESEAAEVGYIGGDVSNHFGAVYYKAEAVGTEGAVTVTNMGGAEGLWLARVSGHDPDNPLDVYAWNNGGVSARASTPTGMTGAASADGLVVGIMSANADATPVTPPSGWTEEGENRGAVAWTTVTAGNTAGGTFTHTSRYTSGAVVVFRAPVVAASGTMAITTSGAITASGSHHGMGGLILDVAGSPSFRSGDPTGTIALTGIATLTLVAHGDHAGTFTLSGTPTMTFTVGGTPNAFRLINPVEDLTPPILPEGSGLFRHYKSRAQGRNVFLLTDGTVTLVQPASWDDIDKVWYGGHVNTVTPDEKAILESAGFTVSPLGE